jgi:nucleoside diphosphate kinase
MENENLNAAKIPTKCISNEVENDVHIYTCFDGVSALCLQLADKLALVKKQLVNEFSQPVDLMIKMTPQWAHFLSGHQAYGQFAFVSSNIDVRVAVTVVKSNSSPELENQIETLFDNNGFRVVNLQITCLSQEQAAESYHQRHLQHPLENQRYQLFLLALENRLNWVRYQASVDDWEISHFVKRYLVTHLTCGMYNGLFEPFYDLHISYESVREHLLTAFDEINADIVKREQTENILLKTYS